MSKDINFNLKALQPKLKKLMAALNKHGTFIAIMVVLVIYLIVVLRISQLAGAEPSPAQDTSASAAIPKIDKKAIEQIQSLEQSNTQVQSLFNAVRSNPFSE